MTDWNDLSRPEKQSLQTLYGGGSLRSCGPEVRVRLLQLGLIEGKKGHEQLSRSGWDSHGFYARANPN